MEVVLSVQEKDSEWTDHISKCSEEAQDQAYEDLDTNLRLMVNTPAFSDVAFLCKDEVLVRGCRILLASRSDVLRNMFMNGMAESSLSEIALPEISSQVLLSVFEFLYTGTVRDYLPQSWRMACEVVVASRFFLLPELEMITRKCMRAFIVAEDLPTVASLLTEALEFKALSDQTDVSLRELVTLLSSNWADSDLVRDLSEEAFHYLLANSKGKGEDVGKLSLIEYLRFRQVIRWWVYFGSRGSGSCKTQELHETEELVSFIVPDEKRALSMCMNPNTVEIVESPQENGSILLNDWNSLQLDETSRNAAIRLLSNIDYRSIHPKLLATVVEPLKISSKKILNAFRFHALHRPMVFKTFEYGWEHGESYGVVEQGCVLHRTGTKTGIAMLTAAMSRPCFVYQWRFIVEEIAQHVHELGFIYCTGGMEAEKPKLDGERLSQQRCARVLAFQGKNAVVNRNGAGGRDDWQALTTFTANTTVLLSFNTLEHTCCLSINGKYFKDVWENLPSAVYYPAVCLGDTPKGRVRVELVRGFDTL